MKVKLKSFLPQTLSTIRDCVSKKPDMFAHKLKFILLPQLIATLNNYACALPPLANGLLSLNAFCRPCKSTTGEMAPKREGSKLAVGT